jgi:HPr kinase/phosphorylase
MHGTCVAVGSVAAILRGMPGAGKSDLALRFLYLPAGMLAGPPALVSDDQTFLRRVGEAVIASCPQALQGRIEVRGLGIARVSAVAREARLTLLADLDSTAAVSEPRFPDALCYEDVLGLPIRRIVLNPFDASAPVKLALVLQNMLEDPGIN